MARFSWFLVGMSTMLLAACAGQRAPQWVEDPSNIYPGTAYLSGIGMGSDRAKAEDRARAEIAKIFQVEIRSRELSEESHWLTGTGDRSEEQYRQQVSSELTATSSKIVQGVHIAEVWLDQKTGQYHALAVLDRLSTARRLRADLEDLDQHLEEQIRLAEQTPSPMRGLGHYLRALQIMQQRRQLAPDLRVVDPGGWAPEPPLGFGELNARADRLADSIRVGIELENDREGIVKGALVRTLAATGMKLATSLESELVIRGTVRVESGSGGGVVQFRVATAQVEFLEKDGRLLDSLRVSVKEGSQSAQLAEIRAKELLGKRLAGGLIEKLGYLAVGTSP